MKVFPLTKPRRATSSSRFIKWTETSRLLEGYSDTSCPTPIFVTCPKSPSFSSEAQIFQLKLATESLERAQRARLNRIALTWDTELLRPTPPIKRYNGYFQLVGRLLRLWRRSEALAFDSYLTAAHLHTAVARPASPTSRRWFANWRVHALAALRLGLTPRGLMALLRSTPVAGPTRAAPSRPARHSGADPEGLRVRLENVIFPNAPGTANSFRHLTTGDGPATAQI